MMISRGIGLSKNSILTLEGAAMQNRNENLNMLCAVQYFLSVLVIMLHCVKIFPNDFIHFVQKSIFSRMAVPFFIVCSSYMIRLKQAKDPIYFSKYIKKSCATYIKWSIIFFPYAINYFQNQHFSLLFAPIALTVGVLYTGMCYHLWYIPAFLFGVYIVNKLISIFSLKRAVIISSLLYLIGCIETYSSYLQGTVIFDAYLVYAKYFFTTRNGLFYVPIYVCLGYILYDYRFSDIFCKNYTKKFLFSLVLFIMEGFFIFFKQGIDKNFFVMLAPYTLFFFNWCVRTYAFRDRDLFFLKKYSVGYFFVHPIFVELFPIIFGNIYIPKELYGLERFCFSLFFTHYFSKIMIFFPNFYCKLARIKSVKK